MSDEELRSIYRQAGTGDLEAARKYVAALERAQGTTRQTYLALEVMHMLTGPQLALLESCARKIIERQSEILSGIQFDLYTYAERDGYRRVARERRLDGRVAILPVPRLACLTA